MTETQPLKQTHGSANTILVVEDEPVVRRFLERALAAGGYDVVGATNGLEALARWEEDPQRFGLVLTDLNMPKMNGNGLIAALRTEASPPPILVCSGEPDRLDEVRRTYGDSVNLLAKPCGMPELLQAVSRARVQRGPGIVDSDPT
jgi:CheY-like chemotaxis protein